MGFTRYGLNVSRVQLLKDRVMGVTGAFLIDLRPQIKME